MNTIPTVLPGVVIIEPRVLPDPRGFFFESYHAERYAQAGISATFVQDNHSSSVKGTIRGLHYQLRRPQGKLLRVIRGSVFDVAVDIRRGSPTFAHWAGEYKCTDFYVSDDQHVIVWNDPTIGIRWPVDTPLLSEGDRAARPLQSNRVDLPTFEEALA